MQKKPDPCSFIIFGATGDLTHRLVVPALYNLAAGNLLPEKFCVVGVGRSAMSDEELRESLLKGLKLFATRPMDDDIAKRLLECVTFSEVRKHQKALQDIADANGGTRASGTPGFEASARYAEFGPFYTSYIMPPAAVLEHCRVG